MTRGQSTARDVAPRAATAPPAARSSDTSPAQTTVERRSISALVALLLFAWGMSFLLFDWLRREIFEPVHASHLILVLPFFVGAAASGVMAVAARWMHRTPVGGSVAHRFGLASGLLGLFAVFLLLFLGPSVQQAKEVSRVRIAELQLADVSAALERYRQAHSSYPVGSGMDLISMLLLDQLPADFELTDPWGHELRYQSLDNGASYLLLCAGPDGMLDLPLAAYAQPGVPPAFVDDLVIIDGVPLDGRARFSGVRTLPRAGGRPDGGFVQPASPLEPGDPSQPARPAPDVLPEPPCPAMDEDPDALAPAEHQERTWKAP